MNRIRVSLGIVSLVGIALAHAQTPPAKAPAVTDVYHIHFAKAAPGQAIALGQNLQKQEADAPMKGHLVVLRHQEGDDWDYCVIEHLGTTATVKISPPPPASAPVVGAWHNDTFAGGPSWAAVSQALGLTNPAQTVNSVYVVGVLRPVPGHRAQLEQLLATPDPAAKVPVAHVQFVHLEGGPWTFLSVDRYNSWQDFAADHAASVKTAGTGKDGWSENRQHVAYHTDTLADRLAPR